MDHPARKKQRTFKDVLASRHHDEQLSETSREMLQEAVFHLISHHQDFNALVAEASTEERNDIIEDKTESQQDGKDLKEVEFSVSGCIAALNNQSTSTGVALPVLAANTCVSKLCEILGNRSAEDANNKILSTAERRVVNTLVSIMKKLSSTQSFHRSLFVNRLNKQCHHLPLELLWQLHLSSMMPLDAFITASVGKPNVISGFTEDMVEILESGSTQESDLIQNILADLLSALIIQAFPEKHQSDRDKDDVITKGLQKACAVILDSAVLKILEKSQADTNPETKRSCLDLFQVLRIHADHLPLRVLQRFVSHQLTQILTHNASLKATEVFSKQQETGMRMPERLSTLFQEAILILGSNTAVVQMLQRIVDSHDVNWQLVLHFITTFAGNFTKAGDALSDWIRSLLQEAFEDSNKEKLTTAFLFARQASLEGPDVFPSYSQWFQSFFMSSNSSLANNKKTFTFLMEFLTEIMPFEAECWLKVHIVNPPYVVPKCKELYLDYVTLAKTRIADLGSTVLPDCLSESSLHGNNSHNPEQQKKKQLTEQAQQDVEKAITAFERNSKIPSTVMEASIFRKPYFLGHFLVYLLKPRLLPDIPDSRMKFIDSLRRSDKIPTSMYQNYQKACQNEISSLLEGAFTDDPEEADLEPLDQLKHSLDQLLQSVLKCTAGVESWQKALSAPISIISERIQSVIGMSRESSGNVGSVFELDVECPSVSSSNLQLIDVLLNGFGKTLVAAASHGINDSIWCAQFVHMLSSHKSIHPALYARLWCLICQQGSSLEECQLRCLAVFLLHLGRLEDNFLPVQVNGIRSDILVPMSQRNYIYPLICKHLYIHTKEWMTSTLRFFSSILQHAFLSFDVVTSSAQSVNRNQAYIPHDLIRKFYYLVPRLYPDTRWNIDAQIQSSAKGPTDLALAYTIYKSPEFQDLQKNSGKISLKDLLSLELHVQPHEDMLNAIERHDYLHWAVHIHYLSMSVDKGGCGGSYRQACNVLMYTLLEHDSLIDTDTLRNHGNRSCDRCKPCDQCGTLDSKGCRSDIICCLQELIPYIPMEKQTPDEELSCPWLLREMFTRLQMTSSQPERSVAHQLDYTEQVSSLFRLVQRLPGYLLYTDCPINPITSDTYEKVAQLIDKHLRQVLVDENFPCVLSYSVTQYLLMGFLSAVSSRNNEDLSGLSSLFQESSSLLHSVVFHWTRLKPMTSQVCANNYPPHFKDLDKIHQWAERLVVSESKDTTAFPTATSVSVCPLTLAVAVYQAMIDRKAQAPPTSVRDIIVALRQRNPSTGKKICSHMMQCLVAAVANQTYYPEQQSYQTSVLSHLVPAFPDSFLSVFIDINKEHSQNKLDMPPYINKLHPVVFFRLMRALKKPVHQQLLPSTYFCTAVLEMYNSCIKLHTDIAPVDDTLPVHVKKSFQNEVLSLQFMDHTSAFVRWCISQSSLAAVQQIPRTTMQMCDDEMRNAVLRRTKSL